MKFRSPDPYEAAFLALSLLSVVPLWLVHRPPLQDFPQHLATVRVLLDHSDQALHLAGAIAIDLSRTQYLTFYLVACGLSKMVGVMAANKLLLSAAIIGTPYALAALLGETGGDRRLALVAIPLAYNAHVLLGFLNFVTAIPLALWALYLAARLRKEPSVRQRVLLAALMLVLFYTHVVPFGFALLGSGLLLWGSGLRESLANLLAIVPALIGAAYWARNNPAGESTLAAVSGILSQSTRGTTRFDPFEKTLREWPEWVTDVMPGSLDVVLLVALCALLVAVVPLSSSSVRDKALKSMHRRLWILAPTALIASFVLPYQHDWIWPVAGRFPYLAAIFLPLLFAPMRPRVG